MRKCFNNGMYYFMKVYFKFCGEYPPYGELDDMQFSRLSSSDKKLYLKETFEKTFPKFYGFVQENVRMYELQSSYSQLTSGEQATLEKWKQVEKICDCVQSSIDKAEGKSNSPVKFFNCFLHEDKTPSMNYWAQAHGFHCFGCGGIDKIIDIFNLVSLRYEWEGKEPLNFGQQFKIVSDWYVQKDPKTVKLSMFGGCNGNHPDFIKFTPEMNKTRHMSFLGLVELKNDNLARAYLEKRGIDPDVAYSKGVMVQYPKNKDTGEYYGRGYITFINSNGTYVRRLFVEEKSLSEKCEYRALKYWNSRETGVFNAQVISHAASYGECVFVCEGAMDALSCETLGFHAIALNSVDNANRFLSELSEENMVKYICLSDNDDSGWIMAEKFKKAHLFVSEHFITKEGIFAQYKDVNECLVANADETCKALEKLVEQANEFYKY